MTIKLGPGNGSVLISLYSISPFTLLKTTPLVSPKSWNSNLVVVSGLPDPVINNNVRTQQAQVYTILTLFIDMTTRQISRIGSM
mgnify:CR=1 FL=1